MDPRSIAFLIEALMALGTTRRSTVESLTERVAGPGAFDHLIAVPGIERHGDLVTVDEGKLAPGHRSTRSDGPSPDALGLAVDACLLEGDLAEAGRFAI
ncbi:MAG TPA: hypothetical protein PKE56_15750, partial [Acidimicrobiales bacterium]|nr:hypothetical protein [Acidimicrobiales bacterium]